MLRKRSRPRGHSYACSPRNSLAADDGAFRWRNPRLGECSGWVHAKGFFEYGIEIGEVLHGGHGHARTGRECGVEFREQELEGAGVDD